jgi:hypothetical protein
MLAMKLMSMRIDASTGQKDLGDILNLIDVMGIIQKADLMRFAQSFYPEARVSARVVLGIDAVWRERTAGSTRNPTEPQAPHEPPRYLDRSGPPPK